MSVASTTAIQDVGAGTDPHRSELSTYLLTPDRRRGWLVAAIVLILWGHFGVIHPARFWLSDFRAFYAAGCALRAGIGPYDTLTIHNEIGPHLPGSGQRVLPYMYPPPTLPLVYAIAALPLETAQIVWCTFQYAMLVAAAGVVLSALSVPRSSRLALLIIVGFLLSNPVCLLFRWGQWDGLVVLLASLAFAALRRPKPVTAGLLIGAAALAKLFPLVYLWVFVIRRQWRALGAAVGLVVALMAASLLLMSPDNRAAYYFNTAYKSSGHHHYLPKTNASVFGFAHRALVHEATGTAANRPWVDLGPRVAYGTSIGLSLLIVAVTTTCLIRHRRRLSAAESLATMIPMLMLITPVAWPHHAVQMLIPLALISITLIRQPSATRADALWVLIMVLLYVVDPIVRWRAYPADWISHLVSPLLMYAILLAWLFMLVRYLPLRDGPNLSAQGASAPQIP